jgi:hypothetical protein
VAQQAQCVRSILHEYFTRPLSPVTICSVNATSQPNLRRRRLTNGLIALAGIGPASNVIGQSRFKLFDALLHHGKPDLRRQGFQSLPMVNAIWRPEASHEIVDEPGLRVALAQMPPGTATYFLDIENWPVLKVSPQVRQDSIAKLLNVAQIARRFAPASQFGFYALPPAVTYWPLVEDRPAELADWQKTNRQLEPLADLADCIFPSIYTFYENRRDWLIYATATIRAARRYGKPVYPFLWFEYHDSNILLRGRELDGDAWKEELQFCREHADGIVLWGGYQQPWDDRAQWWQTVRSELHLPA